MRVKIKKVVLGEEYLIYLRVQPDTHECTFHRACREETLHGTISEDFKKISLKEPLVLKGHDWKTEKTFKELKVPKESVINIKEYITGDFR